MNNWELKQLERQHRYEERARKAEQASEQRVKHAFQLLDEIPPGQPILVGHHSEKRHRAHLAKVDKNMEIARRESSKADHYLAKADGVNDRLNGSVVASDDPDAVSKLQARIAELEADQERDKAINKVINSKPKPKATPEKIQKLEGMGVQLSDHDRVYFDRLWVPACTLSNRSANIRRLKQRLAKLESMAKRESSEVVVNGVTVVENVEANRLQLFFDGKPSEDVRAKLKRSGFRWARSAGAWQRHLSGVYKGYGVDFVERLYRTSEGE